MTHIDLKEFTKRPGETRNVQVDFYDDGNGALPEGETVDSYVSGYPKALLLPDETDTPAVFSASSVATPNARAVVTGVSDGERYKLIFRVNFSNGEIAEHALLMRVEKP